jgi:Protein of unknown function (DUF3891)
VLFRQDGEAVVAITQPAHAWLSGQIARAWGNETFAPPSPRHEVCLGAELHDIGWLEWEAAPTFDPATGLPHEFRAVGAATHSRLWNRGVELARAYGRYPALLVSLHANTIYSTMVDVDAMPPSEAAIVRGFLAGQRAFQEAVRAALASDRHLGAHATPEALERNRLLVGAADRMSLAVCWGVGEDAHVPNAPTRTGNTCGLRLHARGGDREDLVVDPWPFAADQVELACEGVRLRGPYAGEAAMREALATAERVPVVATLRPD